MTQAVSIGFALGACADLLSLHLKYKQLEDKIMSYSLDPLEYLA